MVAAVGLGVVALLGWHFARQGPTLGQVERRVRAEVPLGSTRQEVETWLRRNSIEFVVVQGATTDQHGPNRVVDMAGFGHRPIGATIRATVTPALVSLVWGGEVNVYFFFDADGCLIGYAFHPWTYHL